MMIFQTIEIQSITKQYGFDSFLTAGNQSLFSAIQSIMLRNSVIQTNIALVIAMYGATIGKLGILDISTTVNQACCVLPENETMYTKYVFYYLMVAKNDLIQQSKGGGQPNISQETIKNEKFLIPPINEQRDIANYIDNKCNPINTAIEAASKMISLLHERKQIIINNVVTGKVKVI